MTHFLPASQGLSRMMGDGRPDKGAPAQPSQRPLSPPTCAVARVAPQQKVCVLYRFAAGAEFRTPPSPIGFLAGVSLRWSESAKWRWITRDHLLAPLSPSQRPTCHEVIETPQTSPERLWSRFSIAFAS